MLKPQFRTRRTGQRYDCAQVDAFVERLVATAERRSIGPDVTVDDVRGVAFSTPFLGAGYAIEEVDAFLADAERWLPRGAVPTPTPAPTGGRVAPKFTPVRWRLGYAMQEVDDFVDRVLATANGLPVERPVTVEEIRNVQFTPVRMNEGYDASEVDEFLDIAQSWLG